MLCCTLSKGFLCMVEVRLLEPKSEDTPFLGSQSGRRCSRHSDRSLSMRDSVLVMRRAPIGGRFQRVIPNAHAGVLTNDFWSCE